ncbi:MAG TPA: hypothetical protein PKI36_15430, partial [Turneriella sp.]|nr:hypothetical protein [Turneriella sp.]
RLTAQADGRRTLRLQSPLEFSEDPINLAPFEFAWEKSTPLVHPPRVGAVYDIVFTLDQFMESEETKVADAEETEATANKGDLYGNLVSAQDPEYKPEPASESPAETETPEGSEEASPADTGTGTEREPETAPENE